MIGELNMNNFTNIPEDRAKYFRDRALVIEELTIGLMDSDKRNKMIALYEMAGCVLELTNQVVCDREKIGYYDPKPIERN